MYYNGAMDTMIKRLFQKEKIEYVGVIPFSECKVINAALYERLFTEWQPKSVIVFLVPYYSSEYEGRNISLYAVPRDYHLYFKKLFCRFEAELKNLYPESNFKGCADHSPIGETYAAAKAGLGVIGDLFQLINEKYGSYCFIGEIYTDMELSCYDTVEVKSCEHCGICLAACPSKEHCLSDITQKKDELSENEIAIIKNNGTAWGCDICRISCPMNSSVAVTPIEFFKTDLTPKLTYEMISNMDDLAFAARAYAWRKKKTVLRNLKILGD